MVDLDVPLLSCRQRYLLRAAAGGATHAYGACLAVRVARGLDRARLVGALRRVAGRHDLVRSALTVPTVDLRSLPAAARAQCVEDLWRALPGPACGDGPTFRCLLVTRSAGEDAILMWIAASRGDLASLHRVIEETAAAYHEQPLPEPLAYADFTRWQQALLADADAGMGRAFWRARLTTDARLARWPGEHAAAADAAFVPAVETVCLDARDVVRVTTLAGEMGVAPSTVFFACWGLLLEHATASPDVSVGLMHDGRDGEELADAIGPYTEAVPLRAGGVADASLRQRIAHARREFADAARWRAYFTWDADAASWLPFLFEELPAFSPREAGAMAYAIERQSACLDRFTLKLTCHASDAAGPALDLCFDTARCPAETARRLGAQYAALLARCVAEPDAPVESGWLMSADERRWAIETWNQPRALGTPRRPRGGVHELFEAQARRTPDAIAIGGTHAGDPITYDALNQRANQLAHRLRADHHVGPDIRVALCLDRGADLIVAILAVLKAGGAYAPLDPAQPTARLHTILAHLDAAVVLTHQRHVARLPATVTTLCLDEAQQGRADERADNPRTGCHDDSAAYVLYTSGSTGLPKGVVITHGSLTNYVTWCVQAYDVASCRVAPVHTSIAFDLTITSLFPVLLTGGRVELLPEEPGVDALWPFAGGSSEPAIVKLTPAQLDLLVEQAQVSPAPRAGVGRATLVVGGEALSTQAVRAWSASAAGGRGRLINEYGPTEATVGCCVYEVSDPTREDDVVPIGRPVAHAQLYVLDRRGEPTPVGLAGELFIAGAGLARGYLGAPALTAAAFVPNPFGDPGARMYRTGDVARLRPDGALVFLGRVDDQVKIRGYRIEPGEVEHALRRHPRVQQAAVLAEGDARHRERLHAYIVAASPAPDEDELRTFLAAHVPAYMVPAAWSLVERLPLTVNGKIDRRALAALAGHGPARARVAPRDAWEAHLVRIWEDVLQVRPIGVRDRFFEMGGQSFLAIRLIARVQRELGKRLPVTTLFEGGTIEHMARALCSSMGERGSPVVSLQPRGAAPPFFCVQPIGGSAYSYVPLARAFAPRRAFHALGSHYWLDAADLRFPTVAALAAHYVQALRQAMPAERYVLGGWSSGGAVALEMAGQLATAGVDVPLVALIDSMVPAPTPAVSDAARLLLDVRERSGGRLELTMEEVMRLPDDRQIAHIRDVAVGHGLLEADISVEQVETYITQLQRADRLVCAHAPRRYDGHVILFRASDRPDVIADGDRGGGSADADQASPLDWQRFLSTPLDVRSVPGGHITMVREPHVSVLAHELQQAIAGAVDEVVP